MLERDGPGLACEIGHSNRLLGVITAVSIMLDGKAPAAPRSRADTADSGHMN